ncbi:MAG: SdrD B-like domain-containing protein, partial [Clostridium sp.]
MTTLKYAVTKHREGAADSDSDLIAASSMLQKENEYIIPAKRIADAEDTAGVERLYGAHADSFLIHTALGYYDINKVDHINGYDAGLRTFEQAQISGRIWDDANYDGLMQETEAGLNDVSVNLMQYYYDSDGKWKQSDTFTKLTTTTDADGNYVFSNQDTYVLRNGKYYLAGYKLEVVNTDGTKPDRDVYAITRYRSKKDNLRNSNLRSNYQLCKDDEYQIIAKSVGKAENRQQVIKIDDFCYDFALKEDAVQIDGGFSKYQTSELKGRIFDDSNYDGRLNSSELFSNDLKEALKLAGRDRITVTITYFYKEDGGWKPLKQDGTQKTETQDVLCEGDGSFTFQNLPTVHMIDKKEHLVGYRLQFDGVPDGYRLTKPLTGKGEDDSSARFQNGDAILSKTTKFGYVGNRKEEHEGYIISSAPSLGSNTDMNYLEGFDCVSGRTLTDYNIGLTKQQDASISGRVFYDQDYDGAFKKPADTGMNDIVVYLQQYYYDTATHTWQESQNNTQQITLADGTRKTFMMESKTKSSAYLGSTQDGIYTFTKLPTYVEIDGRTRLSAYRIFMQDVPDGYMATYLHKKDVSEENDSDLDLVQENLLHPRAGSGYLVAAQKIETAKPEAAYIYEAENQYYDIVAAQNIVQLDAGMTTSKFGSIEGIAFEDTD